MKIEETMELPFLHQVLNSTTKIAGTSLMLHTP